MAILRRAQRSAEKAAGIIRENIDAREVCEQLIGERVDFAELGEIRNVEVGREFPGDSFRLGWRTSDDNHVMSIGGKTARGGRANPVAGASDDDNFFHDAPTC